MLFYIKQVKNGYKVCLVEEPNKYFSKKPISKEKAIKQRKAIGMSEYRKKK